MTRKFTVTFKDPDGVWDSIAYASKDLNVDKDEIKDHIRKWIQYSKYVTLEFDLDDPSYVEVERVR